MVTTTVNASTRQSAVTSAPSFPTLGRFAVFTRSSALMPIIPSADPSTAPKAPSSTLSVSILWINLPLPAPMAARIAISLRRPIALASRRFATFAHAISNTMLTAQIRMMSASRTLFHQCLSNRLNTEALFLQRVRILPTELIRRLLQLCLRLCEGDAFLDSAGGKEVVPWSRVFGSSWKGTQTSGGGPNSWKSKPFPTIPITRCGSPPNKILLPTTFGSLANRRLQNPSLIRTTRGPLGRSSSAEKTFDRGLWERRIPGNSLHSPEPIVTAQESRLPSSSRLPCEMPPTFSTTLFCSRQC